MIQEPVKKFLDLTTEQAEFEDQYQVYRARMVRGMARQLRQAEEEYRKGQVEESGELQQYTEQQRIKFLAWRKQRMENAERFIGKFGLKSFRYWRAYWIAKGGNAVAKILDEVESKHTGGLSDENQ